MLTERAIRRRQSKKEGQAKAKLWLQTASHQECLKIANGGYDYGVTLSELRTTGLHIPHSQDRDYSWGFVKQVKSKVYHSLHKARRRPEPQWDNLLAILHNIRVGDRSNAHEHAIASILHALFTSSLGEPQMQVNIHGGRKRIDITYRNQAIGGFFKWLARHYKAQHVFVECKNYNPDPANPELDQLSGRFSPLRGQFGLLICRSISDKSLIAQRCRDTALDHRGFIVCLDDNDLCDLIQARGSLTVDPFSLLRQRFDNLIM
ncbi:hypothetical protein [Aureliella helgolandensis]|uniref:Restriction endonuclease type IV Mrr domain-containing protein n=1 Tax=Aureliella helgolandensis TaxID=2527968 RepID=A0A518G2T4_9BACT|nr:hypothetical protein [Aureliella helgolandensis]QDV22904.1 hypothetical protein Q31a_11970 [Aureliella helgolandensis]